MEATRVAQIMGQRYKICPFATQIYRARDFNLFRVLKEGKEMERTYNGKGRKKKRETAQYKEIGRN